MKDRLDKQLRRAVDISKENRGLKESVARAEAEAARLKQTVQVSNERCAASEAYGVHLSGMYSCSLYTK